MNPIDCRTLEGNWHILIGRLRQKCGEFHHDDLKYRKGKEEELMGVLEKRTKMTKQQIRKFITKLPVFSRGEPKAAKRNV